MLGYVAVLLGTLPLALPCWNLWLADSLGRWVTIQQIHLAEYAGLGIFAAAYARAGCRPWRTRALLMGVLAAVGTTDELLQGMLPQRFFEWSDVGMNLVGGAGGMLAAEIAGWMSGRISRAA